MYVFTNEKNLANRTFNLKNPDYAQKKYSRCRWCGHVGVGCMSVGVGVGVGVGGGHESGRLSSHSHPTPTPFILVQVEKRDSLCSEKNDLFI